MVLLCALLMLPSKPFLELSLKGQFHRKNLNSCSIKYQNKLNLSTYFKEHYCESIEPFCVRDFTTKPCGRFCAISAGGGEA